MRIGIVGAGAIGSYVGLSLAAAGAEVRALLRRPEERARHMQGLTGQRYASDEASSGAGSFRVTCDPDELSGSELVAVAVKSGATAQVAAQLASIVAPSTPVLSLQNGLHNAQRLREAGLHGVHGVVSFNVRAVDHPSRLEYLQATSGPVVIDDDKSVPRTFDALCERAGLPLKRSKDIHAVARGKLVINLNNGVCAVAGVSIAESVRTRDLRRCYAACMREALALFASRNESVRGMGRLSPALISRVLPGPNALVMRLAKPMVQIDPAARSSTLVDLEAGRPTEIDELNGKIVELAEDPPARVPVPANRVIRDLVLELGQHDKLRHPSAAELWARVQAAQRSA